MIKECPICKKLFNLKPSHASKRVCCSLECRNIHYKGKFAGSLNPNYRHRDKEFVNCLICDKNFIPKTLYVKKQNRICSDECNSKHICMRMRNYKPTSLAIEKQIQAKFINKQAKINLGLHKEYCKCGNKKSHKSKTCTQCRAELIKKKCKMCDLPFKARSYKNVFCSKSCYIKGRSIFSMGANNPNWKGGIKPENQKQRSHKKYFEWRQNVFLRDDFTCKDCSVRGGQLHAHHLKAWSKFPELRFNLDNGVTLCVECHNKYHPALKLAKLHSSNTKRWTEKKGKHYMLPSSKA